MGLLWSSFRSEKRQLHVSARALQGRHGEPECASGVLAWDVSMTTSTVRLVSRSAAAPSSRSIQTSITRASARAAGSTLRTSFLKIILPMRATPPVSGCDSARLVTVALLSDPYLGDIGF